MSTDRDVTRTVRSWLEEGVTALPDPVLDAVLDQLPSTPQRRPATWTARRFPIMTSNIVRVGLAAAIVVGLAFVGFNIFGGGDRIGGPAPSDEVATPSPAPSGATQFPDSGEMEPGTYLISEPFPLEIELTLAEVWFPWTPGVGDNVAAIFQDTPDPPDGRVIVFVIVDDVYADPCDVSAGLVDPGSSVADLAAALVGQPDTDSTEPVDVTIGAHSGVYLDYTYTADGGCGTLQRWPSQFGNRAALAGERDQVWILDVDGTRLVIDAASFAGTEESDLAEMRTIVESLTIRP